MSILKNQDNLNLIKQSLYLTNIQEQFLKLAQGYPVIDPFSNSILNSINLKNFDFKIIRKRKRKTKENKIENIDKKERGKKIRVSIKRKKD